MAAGIIQGTVTTTTGETIELSWLVDETGAPTKWWNTAVPITATGVAAAFGSGVRGATVQRVTIATDDVVPVTGTFWQATQPVSLASVPSHAVTNAGTFVVQATLSAETTKVIGVTRTVGSAGAVLDAAGQNAAAPVNALQVGGQFNTTPTTITNGNFSPFQLDNAGRLIVNIGAGASSGAVAQGSTTSGQTGSLIQASVTTGSPTYTTAQTSPLSLDTSGNLRVNVVAGGAGGGIVTQSTGTNLHTVVDSGTVTVTGVATETTLAAVNASITAATVATVADDAADSGNPLKVGGRARTSEQAAKANNDRADFITDAVGKLIVLPYANPENFVSGTTSAMTGTTTTSVVAAPASGLRNYITAITVSNSHATVGTDVIIQDGSGGTTLWRIPAKEAFGGATLSFPTPLRQPTTATAIFCANVTTGASTTVSVSGYKGV